LSRAALARAGKLVGQLGPIAVRYGVTARGGYWVQQPGRIRLDGPEKAANLRREVGALRRRNHGVHGTTVSRWRAGSPTGRLLFARVLDTNVCVDYLNAKYPNVFDAFSRREVNVLPRTERCDLSKRGLYTVEVLYEEDIGFATNRLSFRIGP
jgi:hypothetical protein